MNTTPRCTFNSSPERRREEALRASEEAVEIRRRLAQARPDAFLPDMATSLGVLAMVQTATSQYAAAAAAAHEGLTAIALYVEKHPEAFEKVARSIGHDDRRLRDVDERFI